MRQTLPTVTQIWMDPKRVKLPAELKSSLLLPDLVLNTLYRQGVRTAAEAHAFMDFRRYSPASPYDLHDMEKAIGRTVKAVNESELVGIWGDFDVDGQTSTAVLVSALRKVGARAVYHVPVRGPESHGIRLDVLKTFIKQGVSLLITCDTGISEIESIDWAQSHGVDVIITDHHTLPANLPQAFAVINPQRLEETHPLRPLPGVGVACKFAEALLDRFNQADFSRSLHDLAALGIIADIAELRVDARFLTQSGIDLIRNSPRASIQTMLKAAEVNADQFNEEVVSYSLAPRMNAVGRLADANPMVEFMLSEDPAVLSVTVNQLEGLNARRKLLCDQVFQGAMAQIERTPSLLDHQVLMLAHPEWPAGVVGIVASRLVSIFHRPVMLFVSPPGEKMRGSARSVEGINITAAIRQQSALLSTFGGHPMAAGLSLEPENFKQLQRALDQSVEEELSDHPLVKQLQIDSWESPSTIDLETLESIDRLAPFGAGNPPLVFASRAMRLVSATPVGKTHDHLQMIVEDADGQNTKFIWWQGAGLPQPEGIFDLAYSARSSTYKGKPQIQLEWLDFRSAELETTSLSTKKAKIISHFDCRMNKNPEALLQEIIQKHQPEVYQEGTGSKLKIGISRTDLSANPSLIIWSIPPSQSVLDQIINTVHPGQIFWFARLPDENEPDVFLKTIAKMLKHALIQTPVAFNLKQLASSLAATQESVTNALHWFAARGDITIEKEDEENILACKPGQPDLMQQNESKKRLQKTLAESQAYRRFYLKAGVDSLSDRS